ncbi:MAG: hypothetical protein ACREJO_02110 [Phycisphaerales bacterium]
MHTPLIDESANARPAKSTKSAKAEGSGRKVVMMVIAVAAIGLAIWMVSRSLSEPSGTRPLDEGSATAPPPPPPTPTSTTKPATAPQDPVAGSRRAAPAK